jgi:ABC-type Fe3+-hydroxamate transport system substrate-binding protein
MTTRRPRIVSLLPSATEIVCALGLADSLVGVTHECDYPRGVDRRPQLTANRISHQTMSSAEIDHAVRSQLDGHGSIYDLDEVLLRSLAPDLILTQELCDVCAVSYRTVQQAARRLDTDVTVLSLEPTTIADILANIVTVGEMTGRKAEADALVDGLRVRLDALAVSLRGVSPTARAPWSWSGWSLRSHLVTGCPSRSPSRAATWGSEPQVGCPGRPRPRRSAPTPRRRSCWRPAGSTQPTRSVSCRGPGYPSAGRSCLR